MNKLEPRKSAPILWALTEILGLTIRQVHERSQVPRFRLREMVDGVSDGRRYSRQLVTLAQKCVEEISASSAEEMTMGKDEFKEYRLAAYAAIRLAIETTGRHPDVPADAPRETQLSREILARLPVKGALRRDVVAPLRPAYRAAAIQRCAKRIGVKEIQTTSGRWWIPPRDLASMHKIARPEVKFMKPSTKLQRRIIDRILRILEENPGGVRSTEMESRIAELSTSRALVYRMAKFAGVRRETTGFGATKRTTWHHPTIGVDGAADTDDD